MEARIQAQAEVLGKDRFGHRAEHPAHRSNSRHLSLHTINDPARHVQYGFQLKGPNVWATDTAPFGNIQIAAVPEPSVSALAGLAAGLVVLRRRRA